MNASKEQWQTKMKSSDKKRKKESKVSLEYCLFLLRLMQNKMFFFCFSKFLGLGFIVVGHNYDLLTPFCFLSFWHTFGVAKNSILCKMGLYECVCHVGHDRTKIQFFL